jgi:Ni/Fe-hydrogenase subunit HybB-like protein
MTRADVLVRFPARHHGAWRRPARRLTFYGALFLALLAAGAVVMARRFSGGLGAVTNLSDRWPWGLWVGFDILCGVGLAAGGFVITTVVYVFDLKRYRPIVRPTLVTAFLGYLLVVVALLFDLGRPWNIWHPLVMWNPRSVMFEVSWCVTLYTTVLALEFSGMVFERLGWSRALVVQQAATLPLVVAGAVLSTLHQSSLGSFYLIVPGKLHALWYSPLLPALFWMSAVCAGLGMVIVESRLSARALGRKLELPLLAEVGRVLAGVLFVYSVLRIYDLVARGAVRHLWDGSRESAFFALEFALGAVLPMLLLAQARVRRHPDGLYAAGLLVVLGFVVNRLDVSLTGFEATQGRTYIPAWSELVVTLMLVALGFFLFGQAVKYLPVYPQEQSGARPAQRSAPDLLAKAS